MTPEIFLDMLVSDLTVLLSDCLLPTKTGARRAPKVYKHDLPVPQMDDEDEDADAEDVTAPFVIVRATGGTFDDWSDLHHVGVAIIICTYDDTPDRQGTSDVLGVIERIYHRFARCPDLATSVQRCRSAGHCRTKPTPIRSISVRWIWCSAVRVCG